MSKERVRKYFVPIFDLSIVGVSYLLAYLIRFDFNIVRYREAGTITPISYGVVLGVHAFFYFWLKINKTVWSKTSFDEYIKILNMNFVSGAVILNLRLFGILEGQSICAILIMTSLNMLFMYIARSFYRYALLMHTRNERKQSGKQILIYGAGSAGRLILTEILENSNYDYHVVGFLDDNPTLYKTGIFNTPVLGWVRFPWRNP